MVQFFCLTVYITQEITKQNSKAVINAHFTESNYSMSAVL